MSKEQAEDNALAVGLGVAVFGVLCFAPGLFLAGIVATALYKAATWQP